MGQITNLANVTIYSKIAEKSDTHAVVHMTLVVEFAVLELKMVAVRKSSRYMLDCTKAYQVCFIKLRCLQNRVLKL